MTAVETGTLLMTADEARDTTDKIRAHAETLWQLLLDMHERQGWKALGYASWSAYSKAELNVSRGHAYRLVNHARVAKELEIATGVSPVGDTLSERDARDIAPDVEAVADDARSAVEAGEDPVQAQRDAIQRGRERAAERRDSPEDLRRRLENAQHGRGLFPTGRARDLLREIARQLLERDPADAADVWRAALAAKSNVPALERVLGEIESVEDRAASAAAGDVQEADATSDGGPDIEGGSAPASDEIAEHHPAPTGSDGEQEVGPDGLTGPALGDPAADGDHEGVGHGAQGDPATADFPGDETPDPVIPPRSGPEPDALPPAGSGSGHGTRRRADKPTHKIPLRNAADSLISSVRGIDSLVRDKHNGGDIADYIVSAGRDDVDRLEAELRQTKAFVQHALNIIEQKKRETS